MSPKLWFRPQTSFAEPPVRKLRQEALVAERAGGDLQESGPGVAPVAAAAGVQGEPEPGLVVVDRRAGADWAVPAQVEAVGGGGAAERRRLEVRGTVWVGQDRSLVGVDVVGEDLLVLVVPVRRLGHRRLGEIDPRGGGWRRRELAADGEARRALGDLLDRLLDDRDLLQPELAQLPRRGEGDLVGPDLVDGAAVELVRRGADAGELVGDRLEGSIVVGAERQRAQVVGGLAQAWMSAQAVTSRPYSKIVVNEVGLPLALRTPKTNRPSPAVLAPP